MMRPVIMAVVAAMISLSAAQWGVRSRRIHAREERLRGGTKRALFGVTRKALRVFLRDYALS
jgi:hypothetical protein